MNDHDDQIVDQTLQLIYSQVHRFRRSLYGAAPDAISSIDELRDGPVGQKLVWLARVSRGEERSTFPTVSEMVRAVLDLLFWPVGADAYDIGQPFWDEPLGRMLGRAKWRSVDPNDLISIGDTAAYLRVTRPTIYRWMSTGTIDSVRDDATDRFYLLRSEIGRLQADTARMAAERESLLDAESTPREAADDD